MLASPRIARFLALALLTFSFSWPAIAQPLLTIPSTSPPPIEPETPAEPVNERREENAKLLRVAQRKLEEGHVSDGLAAQEVAHYQSIDAAFAQQDVVNQQIKDLEARLAELEAQLKQPAKAEDATGPYSFVELDRLK